ncbi:MAG: Hsp20 family protein [Propionibacteriales bacterium]|nr:Hsp20 family protein [Propionibacteriales bacterium]
MVLKTWDPFGALARVDREFDRATWRTWGVGAQSRYGVVPAVEISRDGEDVVVTAELPGVDVTKDVEIEVDGRRLVIRGERRNQREEDRGEVYVRELRYGSFRRTFLLPEGVTADDIDATYDKGLLTVRVKGANPSAAGPRTVTIRPVEHAAEIESEPTDETEPGKDAA